MPWLKALPMGRHNITQSTNMAMLSDLYRGVPWPGPCCTVPAAHLATYTYNVTIIENFNIWRDKASVEEIKKYGGRYYSFTLLASLRSEHYNIYILLLL